RAEDRDHQHGGAGDQGRGTGDTIRHARRVVGSGVVLLADSVEQEHLVVSAETEQDGEQQDRYKILDATCCWPSSRAPSPRWKTSTRMPYVAPSESRFSAIALAASRTERNVTSSTR